MKKKFISRVLVLGLSSILCISLIGCGKTEKSSGTVGKQETVSENFNLTGYPIVNEKITIHSFTQIDPQSKDFNKMKILKNLEEKTGIHVEYECISGSIWNEKKNLVLASNELPDIFLGGGLNDSDVIKYGSQGIFIPLEDLIDQYAPNIKKVFEEDPDVKKSCTAAQFKFENSAGPFAPGIVSKNVYQNRLIQNKSAERKTAAYEVYDEFATKEPLPIMSFTNDQLNEIATIRSDIETYVEEMKAKWITGQSDIENEWEEYQNILKKMQVDRYVEIYQEAYDLYQKQ